MHKKTKPEKAFTFFQSGLNFDDTNTVLFVKQTNWATGAVLMQWKQYRTNAKCGERDAFQNPVFSGLTEIRGSDRQPPSLTTLASTSQNLNLNCSLNWRTKLLLEGRWNTNNAYTCSLILIIYYQYQPPRGCIAPVSSIKYHDTVMNRENIFSSMKYSTSTCSVWTDSVD